MTACQPVVAIDGPAGSGKSTVAQLAAERSGLQFVSSGAMYRAVALSALRAGIALDDESALTTLAHALRCRFTTEADGVVRTLLDGEDVTDELRRPDVGQAASTVATLPTVRQALVDKLRQYGSHGGIVMEGRDIQTVVFPHAEIKVFLLASAEVRARRRWQELLARGEHAEYRQVLGEVVARDTQDTERADSPLRAAADAISVETDDRTIDEVVAQLVQLIENWRQQTGLRGDG
jgi:cytidylate kinase